ncbi:hypothetical protein Anapl_10926 [Anas platyrhynchos]|uniref:Uncharacterized protein n=1 Tax=Anas platyrhynchos TaxID=8839 RepID=R0KMK7_ANAPL|nr:hypothetical protein Anapl_10926 [Anas platyrhynchos]
MTETEGAASCCNAEDATSVKQGISVRFLCQVLVFHAVHENTVWLPRRVSRERGGRVWRGAGVCNRAFGSLCDPSLRLFPAALRKAWMEIALRTPSCLRTGPAAAQGAGRLPGAGNRNDHPPTLSGARVWAA